MFIIPSVLSSKKGLQGIKQKYCPLFSWRVVSIPISGVEQFKKLTLESDSWLIYERKVLYNVYENAMFWDIGLQVVIFAPKVDDLEWIFAIYLKTWGLLKN